MIKPLIVFSLLILGEMSLLFGTGINHVLALINEPPAQEDVDPAGLFDFQIDYMGEVRNRKDINANTTCTTGNQSFNLGGWDYFIVKMQKGSFDFVKFGPETGNNATYWSDYIVNTPTTPTDCNGQSGWGFVPGQPTKHMAVDVSGTTKANASIRLRPHSNWGKAGHLEGWRVWRVKVNAEGYPAINDNTAFFKHNGEDYPYTNTGSLVYGCTVSYLMLDDDPASAGDPRNQAFHVQTRPNPSSSSWTTKQIEDVPDGMVVGRSFVVDDPAFAGLEPSLMRLLLVPKDSIYMLHTEQCGDTYSWQVKMKGVFIATAQREREGVGESGFKFERNIFVPAGVAPLLIEYDPKYLIEFASLLGEALVDWVEIPN